jgi:hypothetical protein
MAIDDRIWLCVWSTCGGVHNSWWHLAALRNRRPASNRHTCTYRINTRHAPAVGARYNSVRAVKRTAELHSSCQATHLSCQESRPSYQPSRPSCLAVSISSDITTRIGHHDTQLLHQIALIFFKYSFIFIRLRILSPNDNFCSYIQS